MLNGLKNKIRLEFIRIKYGKKITIGNGFGYRKRLNIRISSGKLKIGHNVFFNNDCSINCVGKIDIGDYCLFGENVKLYDHGHNYSDPSIPIQQQGLKVGTISIGNNCWIGSNVIILSNVTIGDNVIIGANCLIHKSIADNMIVKCIDGKVTPEKNKYYEKI